MKLHAFQHIRTRLTAWHILVFGGILVLYAGATFAFLFFTLNRNIDDGLKEDLEILGQLLMQEPEGSYFQDQHPEMVNPLERFMEIWSNEGRLLYRSRLLGGRSLGPVAPFARADPEVRITSIALSDSTRWRVASNLTMVHGKPVLIRLAISENEYYSDLRNFASVLLIGIPLGLFLVTLSGYMLAWVALRPIDVMARKARRIGTRDLEDRIPIKNPNDELGRLALAFNDLLARIEQAFTQLKRFTADASHELRTPLTAMRSVGEVALEVDHSKAEYQEIIGSMLEESERLTRLVDSLLFLSRADAGKIEIHPKETDLFLLAQEASSLMMVLAEEKGQSLLVEGSAGAVVLADYSLLLQALLNIIDNAVKYSQAGATIIVRAEPAINGWAGLAVIDTGPGIPLSEQERIFERFYRADGRHIQSGSGLGLAIVRWTVEVIGGSIIVESREGKGSTFRMRFPATTPLP